MPVRRQCGHDRPATGRCAECKAVNRVRWSRENRARMNAYQRKYATANAAKLLVKNNNWRRNNPEKVKPSKWTPTPEQRARRQKYFRARYRNNKEAHRTHCRNRRYRLRGAVGTVTMAQWLGLLAKFGSLCLRCGATADLSRDHVIPISRGGTNTVDNIQPLCSKCNSWKGVRSFDFRPE